MKNSMKVILVGFLALFCVGNALAGTMKDPRDGKTYKTVKIGNQVWMAENLNYKMGVEKRHNGLVVDGSWCYGDKPANCKKYGRLYSYRFAKIACPDGWHLPSERESLVFLEAVKKRADYMEIQRELSGKPLREGENLPTNHLRSVRWKGGFDSFGFSALPAGIIYGIGGNGNLYSDLGEEAGFWSENGDGYVLLIKRLPEGYRTIYDTAMSTKGYSIRCLKD